MISRLSNKHCACGPHLDFLRRLPTCRWSSKPKQRTRTVSVRLLDFEIWRREHTDITPLLHLMLWSTIFRIPSPVNWRLAQWLEFVFAFTLGSNNCPDSSLSPSGLLYLGPPIYLQNRDYRGSPIRYEARLLLCSYFDLLNTRLISSSFTF